MTERPNQSRLHLLGVSYRTAPAAVREGLRFNAAEAADLLGRAAGEMPGLEVVTLSTCNRTEFYLAPDAGSTPLAEWIELLRRVRPGAPILDTACMRYEKVGPSAARHLMEVACGLDSSILGDSQILGQVKEAQVIAGRAGTLGTTLSRLFSHALQAGKRARRETEIHHGAASLGSALAGMLSRRLHVPQRMAETEILILGAGAMARNIGRHVAKRRLGRLVFINRTQERARETAGYCGGRAIAWENLEQAVCDADVLIAATSASRPLVSRVLLDRVARERPKRPLIVIDVGLPRNVEVGSAVELIDIDAVREGQADVLARRREAVDPVRRIVETEMKAWERWLDRRPLEKTIKRLYLSAEAASRAAAREISKTSPMTFSDARRIVLKSLKQALHGHVRELRRESVMTEGVVEKCVR